MRKISSLLPLFGMLLILGLAAMLVAQEKSAAAKETISGTLVDLKCYAAGGFLTNDHGGMAGCGTACAKGGLPVGLVDENKKVHFLAVPAPAYADLVGQTLRLTGSHNKSAEVFIPEKLEVKEGDKFVEKKLPKTMM